MQGALLSSQPAVSPRPATWGLDGLPLFEPSVTVFPKDKGTQVQEAGVKGKSLLAPLHQS